MTDDDDLLDLLDDDAAPAAPALAGTAAWKVLVVDDDEDVHLATRLALQDLQVEGRDLQLLHAHSAAQAEAMLAADADIAVALLDGRDALRIILRTGQPGYAPEIETIQRCDINDYRTKSELTRVRLFTSLTGAIRAYRQITQLAQARRGLELVVAASTELGQQQGVQRFAEGVILQLCALLNLGPQGLVCAQDGMPGGAGARVIAAAGPHAGLNRLPLQQVQPPALRAALAQCLAQRRSIFSPSVVLYFGGAGPGGFAACVDAQPGSLLEQHVLEVFCASMAVALQNAMLYEQLVELAYHDPLLGMPNRNRFVELLDERQARPDDSVVAVIDLDDFAGINQMLGHRIGDDLLKAVGQRLVDRLGAHTVIARLGGDVFGALGPEAALRPQALSAAMAEPFEVQGETLRLTASCGLVRLHGGAQRGADLLKDGHIALKLAKERQRGTAEYFDEAMGTDARERMRLLRGLRQAFEEQRLFVVYQPQVCLTDRSVRGAEALLRWRTEDGQFVAPDRFIPLAEQSGLIVAIGEFVLRTACHQLQRLRRQGHARLCMAVNVSQVQFRAAGFVDSLRRALRDCQVDPAALELEITESMAAEDLDFVMQVLADVKACGVSVAIDDFGTGFSSLSVLRRLQVDKLKIDRAFVNDMDPAQPAGSVARMVVELGQSLGMRVIAEGVETEAQCAALKALGCDQGQGYLFARPMPADQLEAWLAQQAAPGGGPAPTPP
ncbi:MAG: diguanylate cyclase [Burkholderiales bacterium PBB5]|nr:MAG: diguanylate cyclase [Burkholderiales bacterium PBB5]